jgi:hypothetical protein
VCLSGKGTYCVIHSLQSHRWKIAGKEIVHGNNRRAEEGEDTVGIKINNFKKADLIRKIQAEEGNQPCFQMNGWSLRADRLLLAEGLFDLKRRPVVITLCTTQKT